VTTRGSEAEEQAAVFLAQQGLTLVARNYRCRYGEIDIIGRDGPTLVFVEVRQRSSTTYGGAAASITSAKQAKVVRAAQHYLAAMAGTPPCRFDVVLLNGDGDVEWLKNAFEA
jgi:putative endonuclease